MEIKKIRLEPDISLILRTVYRAPLINKFLSVT
jgi:hypothetical protein